MIADPGVVSSNPGTAYTFLKIDPDIFSTAILLPSADSRKIFASYKRKYVHEVLVNLFVELAQVKCVVR